MRLTAGKALPQAEQEQADYADYGTSYEDIQGGLGDVIHLVHVVSPFQRGYSLYALCQGGA